MPDGSTFLLGGDLEVRRLGFGAMRITGEGIWGEPADPAGCRELLRHLIDRDVNLIDTADSYGPDVSENLIAEALAPYPENLLSPPRADSCVPARTAGCPTVAPTTSSAPARGRSGA